MDWWDEYPRWCAAYYTGKCLAYTLQLMEQYQLRDYEAVAKAFENFPKLITKEVFVRIHKLLNPEKE